MLNLENQLIELHNAQNAQNLYIIVLFAYSQFLLQTHIFTKKL